MPFYAHSYNCFGFLLISTDKKRFIINYGLVCRLVIGLIIRRFDHNRDLKLNTSREPKFSGFPASKSPKYGDERAFPGVFLFEHVSVRFHVLYGY